MKQPSISLIKLIMLTLSSIYRKIVLLSFIAICTIAAVQGNIFKTFADDRIYDVIKIVLKNQYPDNEKKVECMVDDFHRNKVADKFYSIDLLTNHEKLSREMQPYVDEANLKCTLIEFFQSPLGICVLIAFFLLALSIICCLIRCICC